MIYEARDVTPELCSQYRQNEAICHQLSKGGHGAGALLAMHEVRRSKTRHGTAQTLLTSPVVAVQISRA